MLLGLTEGHLTRPDWKGYNVMCVSFLCTDPAIAFREPRSEQPCRVQAEDSLRVVCSFEIC